MASWTLIPCLEQLFAEFNEIAPGRDKASDGRVGDAAHAISSSDHNPDETGSVPIHDADKINEVHAIDVDSGLNTSDLTMEKVVQFLLARCRSGAERRLRYVIYKRRIWSASSDWVQKSYTGASPHTEHAHFSASYASAREASRASWHLEEIPVALTADDKAWLSAEMKKQAIAAVKDQIDDIASGVVTTTVPAPEGHNPNGWPVKNFLVNIYNEAAWANQAASRAATNTDPAQGQGPVG